MFLTTPDTLKPIYLFLLFGLFALTPERIDAQYPYPPELPSYKQIETEFFTRYAVQNIFVDPVKRQGAYYIRFYSTGRDDIHASEYLFYSAETRQYFPLPLPLADTSQPFRSIQNFYYDESYNFDTQPCYGYPGWYRDAIKYLEVRKNPTEDELNALARAYYSAADALTETYNGPGSLADSVEAWDGVATHPQLSEARLGLFIQRSDRALELFQTLADRNPKYVTPEGYVDTKCASLQMKRYQTLRIFGKDSLANRSADPGQYRAYIRQTAGNMLLSCPPNAVLITSGDTDSYPLWYLQMTEQLRTDVLVMPIAFLTSSLYNVFYYQNTLFNSSAPGRTLPRSYYEKSTVLRYSNLSWLGVSDTIGIQGYFDHLQQPGNLLPAHYNRFDCYVKFRHLVLRADQLPGANKLLVNKQLKRDYGRSDTLFVALPAVAAMDYQTLIDWLATEGWNRPLCFSMTCSDQVCQPFGSQLVIEGLVYRYYPIKPRQWPAYSVLQKPINLDVSWRLWRDAFHHGSSDEITPFDGLPLFQTELSFVVALSEGLTRSGSKRKARTVLNDFCLYYPNSRLLWAHQMLYVARAYARSGDKKAAEGVIISMLDNLDQGRLADQQKLKLEDNALFMSQIIEDFDLKNARIRYEQSFAHPFVVPAAIPLQTKE